MIRCLFPHNAVTADRPSSAAVLLDQGGPAIGMSLDELDKVLDQVSACIDADAFRAIGLVVSA